MEHLRHSGMTRSGVIAACIVSSIVLMGCSSDPPPTAEPEISPQGSVPDLSSLDIAVNFEYRNQESGTSGFGVIIPAACAAGVSWRGAFYSVRVDGLKGVSDPQPAEPLADVVVPGCNDTGGNSEPDVPTNAWAIEGVDPAKAIFVQYP